MIPLIPDADLDAWQAACEANMKHFRDSTGYLASVCVSSMPRLIAAYREQRKLLDWAMTALVDGETRWIEEEKAEWILINEVEDTFFSECFDKAITYLDSRGLLERHPEHSDWVRIKEAKE